MNQYIHLRGVLTGPLHMPVSLKDIPTYKIIGQHDWKEGEIVPEDAFELWDQKGKMVAMKKEQPSPEPSEHTKEMLDLIRYCAKKGYFIYENGEIYELGDIITPEQILEDFKNQQKEK